MKKILLTSTIALSALFSSCSEDFLDVQPSERISAEQVADAAEFNPDVVAGTVRGLYALMYQPETGGTTGHDDFGQKGIDIWSDMLSADMAHQNTSYGWYRTFSALQATVDFTTNPNYQGWRYYYRIIRSANIVIESLGGNDTTPEITENKHFMGQAKAMRAYAYFYLTQLYADSYEPGKEILPLYLEAGSNAQPKEKTSVIFDQITKDLDEAINLLNDFNRSFKNEIDTSIAKSLLAYVYAAKGNYSEVERLTSEVINNSSFSIIDRTEATGGFSDISSNGWMWGADLTAELNYSLATWWAQMDYFTYGYQSSGNQKAIDKSLYDLIPVDDVRKEQFHPTVLLPWNKFYAPARVWDGQRPVVTDYLFMRISEIYLLNAEANAKLGNDVAAITALKAILNERLPSTSYLDALSGNDLIKEVSLQTRIELWGEGKSYLEMKRTQRKVIRGSNHLHFIGEEMESSDNRLSFEIPQSEIQNNTFINDQN